MTSQQLMNFEEIEKAVADYRQEFESRFPEWPLTQINHQVNGFRDGLYQARSFIANRLDDLLPYYEENHE